MSKPIFNWSAWLVGALFVFATLGGVAQAQGANDAESKPAEAPAQDEVTDSADNRRDSIVYLGITPGGVHIPSLLTQPVAVGVYLGDFLIGGEYGSISVETDDGGDRADASFTNAGAFVRWFPGRSFNLFAAVHKRTWEATGSVTYSNGVTEATAPVKFTADAVVGTLGFGNQWISDFGLTFGIDWLVLSGLLSGSVTGTVDASVPPSEKAAAEAELNEFGDFLNTVSAFPGLFIVSIGWSF